MSIHKKFTEFAFIGAGLIILVDQNIGFIYSLLDEILAKQNQLLRL